jgi:acyl transferase domain-containing protein
MARLAARVRTPQQVATTLGELWPELDAATRDRVRVALMNQAGTLGPEAAIGLVPNLAASRIANRLDLGGANYTVDAACASSLAAVDLAVKELITGGSDVVVCGGADLHNSINDYLLFASVHALSTTGRCHTFDAAADGIVLGEGVAAWSCSSGVADAERDGDRIYAVIRGAGASPATARSRARCAPRKAGQLRRRSSARTATPACARRRSGWSRPTAPRTIDRRSHVELTDA